MRIAIITDAWYPQVNGVVRTLTAIRDGLTAAGHEIAVFGPDRYRTIPCPGYASIRLAVGAGRTLGRQLAESAHVLKEAYSFRITSEKPSPSVVGYQESL